jgi:hypothetical protein
MRTKKLLGQTINIYADGEFTRSERDRLYDERLKQGAMTFHIRPSATLGFFASCSATTLPQDLWALMVADESANRPDIEPCRYVETEQAALAFIRHCIVAFNAQIARVTAEALDQ